MNLSFIALGRSPVRKRKMFEKEKCCFLQVTIFVFGTPLYKERSVCDYKISNYPICLPMQRWRRSSRLSALTVCSGFSRIYNFIFSLNYCFTLRVCVYVRVHKHIQIQICIPIRVYEYTYVYISKHALRLYQGPPAHPLSCLHESVSICTFVLVKQVNSVSRYLPIRRVCVSEGMLEASRNASFADTIEHEFSSQYQNSRFAVNNRIKFKNFAVCSQ